MITIKEARHHYEGADAVHDFDHVLRVLTMAERLAREEGADLEIVRTATLLHDVARGHGDRLIANHAQAGAEFARRLLQGYPTEKVEAVAHAIAAHRFRTGPDPQTLEAKVLHDADKLDAIGAIGVARAFAFGGYEGQHRFATFLGNGMTTNDTRHEHTPVHEYQIKLLKIKERLLTESARKLAADRHLFMVAYFERLEQEVRGLA